MSDDEIMSTMDVETDDNDGEYHPRGSPAPPAESSASTKQQQRKRGRKPNPNQSIRSAREAARKANHSVIEKKRREKINQALTELRTLVPADDTAAVTNGTKDFKLEVLVRTVTHLKHLVSRINQLESATAVTPTQDKSARNQTALALPAPCKRCFERDRKDSKGHSVELPPVSSLLTGLPSPPSSGSLASSPVHADVPSLHLPGSTMSLSRIAENGSDTAPPYLPHEQAAYSLLHMSVEQRAAYTPGSLLGMSTTSRRSREHNRSQNGQVNQR
ncbi:hypothetical protein M408DRAFT_23906 [Serendipita vermifera MAFF 305830]|uniref:BHLH domain-containing protein n=1 Tax=Serendipita vermifera MAFF 305830 TaxID=933852 RepID=A0A0C3AUG5_SERVB|nr:hypothetical protein M408DRAFT_23906 [Serendipita vermifera MAFF 305830]